MVNRTTHYKIEKKLMLVLQTMSDKICNHVAECAEECPYLDMSYCVLNRLEVVYRIIQNTRINADM